MSIELIIYIMLIHFLADFALQTHEQAINKSSDNLFLVYHVGLYSSIWLLAMPVVMGVFEAFCFACITFVFHYGTDYITSRVNKSFFSKENYHDGFVGVGFDQLLHYIQLFLTFKLLV